LPNPNVVFVVDDDPAMLQSVARLLRQFGYACLLFPSAEAFANHTNFGSSVCVLLDINLGDGSGIEIGHRLRAAGISVPVIYMTVRMHRLSHKAVLGEIADGATPESIGGLRINRTRRHGEPLGQCTQGQCPLIQL
jgi:FixJ family two-component response regulator